MVGQRTYTNSEKSEGSDIRASWEACTVGGGTIGVRRAEHRADIGDTHLWDGVS